MTGRIVVGVDGSDSSKQALRWATALARASGSPVDAVMSWDIPTTLGLGYLPQDIDMQSETEKWLEQTVEEVFGAERPAWLGTIVRQGSPARVLLDACKNDAAVLVVGSRGHGGFYGLLLGSVSAAVAEHAPCPVLVVHGDDLPLEFTS